MERYDLFEKIQKDLFELLKDQKFLIQQTDFSSIVQTDRFIEELKTLISIFNLQNQQEDIHIYSPMANWEPFVLEKINDSHTLIRLQGARILRLISLFDKLCIGEQRRRTMIHIRRACVEFINIAEEHLIQEKNTMTAVLWKYNNDYDLKAVCDEIKKGRAPILYFSNNIKSPPLEARV